jgi:hypothetical protein
MRPTVASLKRVVRLRLKRRQRSFAGYYSEISTRSTRSCYTFRIKMGSGEAKQTWSFLKGIVLIDGVHGPCLAASEPITRSLFRTPQREGSRSVQANGFDVCSMQANKLEPPRQPARRKSPAQYKKPSSKWSPRRRQRGHGIRNSLSVFGYGLPLPQLVL